MAGGAPAIHADRAVVGAACAPAHAPEAQIGELVAFDGLGRLARRAAVGVHIEQNRSRVADHAVRDVDAPSGVP